MNEANSILKAFVWLIPFLPMLASLLIAIGVISAKNVGEQGEKQTTLIANGAALLSLLIVLAVDLHAVVIGIPGHLHLAQWFSSGAYEVNISFNLDQLGLSMMTLVAIISVLMIRFSVNYMHREAGYQRFFMILSLFMGAMLLIVMSGNVVLTFTGWELAGVSSYLLIAYVYDRPIAVQNATRVFITNRIGDAGFIVAIFLSFHLLNTLEWSEILTTSSSLTPLGSSILAGAFLLAAIVKSAQIPFAPWISRALEGPTPSSAIFYGALMVHAGVYLMIRLQPVLEHSSIVMGTLAFIGLLTALYGFFSNLVQTDVKSNLIFSTTSQVGLMFFSCGMGWFELASWHLVLHAIWRAYQFLHAPAMMHMDRKTRPVHPLLKKQSWLYTASLQRFWLDPLADWLLVRPVKNIAHDMDRFDEKVVNRLVGLPEQTTAISSIADWEKQKTGLSNEASEKQQVTRGYGLAGKLMEGVADILFWFEEHLVLKSGGEGLLKLLNLIGHYLLQIEELLSQPRYLTLLILATFVVII
jgi:NADH:ubiquinone oxidoreductase subunit 5 (subunit L)/multisubunit Na+/H+ antiporter MnhA subunit